MKILQSEEIYFTKVEIVKDFCIDIVGSGFCPRCNGEMDLGLIYMVECLKKENLLPENYELVCCECHSLK